MSDRVTWSERLAVEARLARRRVARLGLGSVQEDQQVLQVRYRARGEVRPGAAPVYVDPREAHLPGAFDFDERVIHEDRLLGGHAGL